MARSRRRKAQKLIVAIIVATLSSYFLFAEQDGAPADDPGAAHVAEAETVDTGLDLAEAASSWLAMASRSPTDRVDLSRTAGDQTGEKTDPEWRTFPRNRLSIGAYLSLLSGEFDVRMMWRHELLNPLDAYIPPNERETLGVIAKGMASVFKRFESMQTQAGLSDAEDARTLPVSSLTPVPSRTDAHGRALVSPDRPGVVVKRGGVSYEVPCPRFRATLELARYLTLEAGNAVIAWFARGGYCPVGNVDLVMRDVIAHSEGLK